jgi:hypothetical protein
LPLPHNSSLLTLSEIEEDDGILLRDTQEQVEETLTSLQEEESMLIETSERDQRERVG